MDEMFGYIFSNMKASEKNIKSIKRVLNSQRRFNGALIFALVGVTICISTATNRIDEQKKRIKTLEERLDKLDATEEVCARGE